MVKIEEQPIKFIASDGHEFLTQQATEQYETIITARDEYKRAKARYGELLAQSQKTADGYRFDMGICRRYYYPLAPFGQRPCIQQIQSLWHNWTFDIDSYEDDGAVIIRKYENGHEYRHSIHELYAKWVNAERALVPLVEAWLGSETADCEALKKRIDGAQ